MTLHAQVQAAFPNDGVRSGITIDRRDIDHLIDWLRTLPATHQGARDSSIRATLVAVAGTPLFRCTAIRDHRSISMYYALAAIGKVAPIPMSSSRASGWVTSIALA